MKKFVDSGFVKKHVMNSLLDWMNYLTLWESLSPDMKRVGELVGVEERFLVRAMRGTVNVQNQVDNSYPAEFLIEL